MTDSTRKARRGITLKETQEALSILVEAMGDDRISPLPAINGSANGLVATLLEVSSGRAAYIIKLLADAGAIMRIDGSYKVRIIRPTVRLENPPVLSDSDKDRYEEAIRRLNSLLEEERARTTKLTVEVEDLKAKLNELTKTDGPSSDVQKIMAGIGVA